MWTEAMGPWVNVDGSNGSCDGSGQHQGVTRGLSPVDTGCGKLLQGPEVGVMCEGFLVL